MPSHAQIMQDVKRTLVQQKYFDSLSGVLFCDFWNALPVEGRPHMSDAGNFLSEQSQKHLVNDDVKALVDYCRDFDGFEDDYQRGAAMRLVQRYDNAVKVPLELRVELSNFCRSSQLFWQECNKKSDWKAFRPNVQKQFDLQARVAEAIDPHRPTYDVLIDKVDEGLTTSAVEKLFSELRDGIVSILSKVREKHAAIDNTFLKELTAPIETKKLLAHKAAAELGFIFDRAHVGERMHPVCAGIGPRDSRPTTNYDLFMMGVISMMHECGHGTYNYNSNDEVVQWGLWGGLSGGLHESQSRFYENMVGKSHAFWKHFYPAFSAELPALKNVDLDTFYTALIKAEPSLQRIGADELTYNLHLIVRFEMEKDYFAGKIKVDDFEEIWAQKYEDYLGVRPQTAREGVLQDVHWSSGHVGYFQSYTLGDLYGAQFRNAMLKDVPDAYDRIAKGDMSGVNTWLKDNVQQYGQMYTPNVLVKKATGEDLSSKYCINYLEEKYLGTPR